MEGKITLENKLLHTTDLGWNKMKSNHYFYFNNSNKLQKIPSKSINLVVTSPPYPMIEMWDEIFSNFNSDIYNSLNNYEGKKAFELMHTVLSEVWEELDRVVVDGGIICINIGDATRKIGDIFELYPNHIKIVDFFINKGYSTLPCIIWRKQSNKPNKFMGSGMLPSCAYVTLEHEYILIFRKGNNRKFSPIDVTKRRESAFFWEERNNWYSDIWFDLKGISQDLLDPDTRKRSAAYPFELAYRLINMFSIMGDNVLDPFLGTGTTSLAAMCSGRNSFGYEIDPNFSNVISQRIKNVKEFQNKLIFNRLKKHLDFIQERESNGKEAKHFSERYNFPVITSQETEICLPLINKIEFFENSVIQVTYQKDCDVRLTYEQTRKIVSVPKKTKIMSIDSFI